MKNDKLTRKNNPINGESASRKRKEIATNKTEIVKESLEKPKRRTSNGKPPSSRKNLTANSEEIKAALQHSLYWYKMPCPKSDLEVAERLDYYFHRCAEICEIPTVENMALAIGTNRITLWEWENGKSCSPTRTNIIKRAKGILAAFDAEMVLNGKLPVVAYIFRSKNYYGMRDEQEVIYSPGTRSTSTEDLRRLYGETGGGLPSDALEIQHDD